MDIVVPAGKAFDYRLGFESLERETEIESLPCAGALPPWLEGTLLRNGPGRFEVGPDRYRHWFDGLAMLHRFTFAGGRIGYANRFLRSPGWIEAQRTGRIARPEFATTPQRTFFEWFGSLFGGGRSDNANVNIVPYGGGYLALTETPSPVAFDGATLETQGVLAYDDDVAAQVTTAHTHYDRERRATFNVAIEFGRKACYKIVRIEDGTLRRTVVASIPVDEAAYVHAFSTTQRYVVIAEYPFFVRSMDLLLLRKPYIDNYRWMPQRPTRFHVVEKDGGALAGTYETEAFFAFHHINAFDDGDSIVLDISAYDDASIVGDLMLDRLLAPNAPALPRAAFRRYRLVPGRSAAEVETVAVEATELPRVAPSLTARPYRYAYGVDTAPGYGETFVNQLVKVDVRERTVATWRSPQAFPGEPVFVPRPGARDEDDGAILSLVLDAAAGTSYLLVLDARTFEETARATVPHHIPHGFHGIFRGLAG